MRQFVREQLKQLYKYNRCRLNSEIEKAQPQILNTMIDEILFVQEALKRNIQVTDTEVQKTVDEIRKQFKTDKEFARMLKFKIFIYWDCSFVHSASSQKVNIN
jgi:hypothetical protein